MNKPLTRRAREYFEVLDSLREEGYVTHEELQLLDAKKQAETSRMTARLIEDTLLERGFSKGSPNEQKRYRLLWMQERGIVAELENPQMRLIEDDPIVGAAIAVRRQLQNDADKLIADIQKKAKEKITEISTKYSDLQKQFTALQEKYSDLIQENEERKGKLAKTEADLSKTIKDKAEVETTLRDKERDFAQKKTDFENGIATQKSKNEELVVANEKYIEVLKTKHKDEISTIKEYAEKRRHDHIIEIDNLKTDKKKLENELEKIKHTIIQITQNNAELTQLSKRLEEEVKHLRAENNTISNERRSIENSLAGTKGEFKQLQSLFNDQKADYLVIQEQLLGYKEKVGRLEEQLQQTKNELDSIRDEQNKQNKQSKQNEKNKRK